MITLIPCKVYYTDHIFTLECVYVLKVVDTKCHVDTFGLLRVYLHIRKPSAGLTTKSC